MSSERKRSVGENLCEVEASAKWYAKNLREAPSISRLANFLKENKFSAVHFDKVNGFSVLKKHRINQTCKKHSTATSQPSPKDTNTKLRDNRQNKRH